MDGLGLAMFLPLLELLTDQNDIASTEKMGNLAFILNSLNYLGLKLTLNVVLVTMFIFFTCKGLAMYFQQYLTASYQQFFIRNIRVENIDALAAYSYYAFVKEDVGLIQNTLSGEVQRVMSGFQKYTAILKLFILVLTYASLAFLANPEFAVLVLIGGWVSNFIFSYLYKKTKSLSSELVKSNHGFQGLLIQEVAFFKYLKSTASIEKYALKLKERVYEIEKAMRTIGILDGIMRGLREPLMIGIVVLVIIIQVNYLGGSLSTIILSLLFFYRCLTSVMTLQSNYNQFLSVSGSLENMTVFINKLKKHQEVFGKTPFQGLDKALKLNKVSFMYDEGIDILKDIDLIINKNETIAFVGESGSGKTTLMNILIGLLKPTTGMFFLDETDSLQIDITTYQKRIGYITQDPVIFDDTIYNNVSFWAEKTPENRLRFEEALKKASILDFMLAQPKREDTRLGNNGINLSGGQKQRISIARELYKEVEFLFMDEATSALDSATEKEIQTNIDTLKGNYTILIIAHRLSTIKNADRVVVLNKGRIERIGSYKQLVKESKAFQRMIALQEV